ncbi:MAG TPA: CHRD domain-containing protein [Longimicrobiales bacterium]|nr:CHRD domain-containing protein [Longimicrobiales bacterium]
MKRKQLISRFLLLASPILVLGACDTGEQGGEALEADTAAAPVAGEVTPVSGIDAVIGADVTLASVDRSGVTGRAFGERTGDGAALTLTVEGLEPDVAYPAHIHSGTCASGGPVVVGLGEITAQADGSGGVSRDVTADELVDEESLFVQVHASDGEAIACGDLGQSGSGT